MKVGLQLYSIRDLMESDMDAALYEVSKAGYEYVEFAGFFGKSAAQINELLSKYDLKAISVHQKYEELITNEEGILDFLKDIGIKYSAIPYMSRELHKGNSEYDRIIEDIKNASENLKKYGIQMLYHNHDFEFYTYEGKYLNDWIIESVGKENIIPEIDTCWVKYAGVDLCGYIKKYSGNVPVLHLKDFCRENGFKMRPVGYGCQDWKAILDTAQEAGTEYLIVEQDHHYGDDPIDNITKSRSYLKELGY